MNIKVESALQLYLVSQPEPQNIDDFHESYSYILGVSERARYETLTRKKQTHFLIGRLLLRFAWRDFLQGADTLLVTEQADFPPKIAAYQALKSSFSMSHSNNLIGLIVTSPNFRSSVGLDIEWVKPVKDFSAAAFFCNQTQLTEIKKRVKTHDKTELYYQYWTQKEAVLKSCLGSVFSEEMKHYSFHTTRNNSQFADTFSGIYTQQENDNNKDDKGNKNNCQIYQIAIHTQQREPIKIHTKKLKIKLNHMRVDDEIKIRWDNFILKTE